MSALLPAPIIRKPPKRSRAQTAEEQLEESRILRRVESAFEAAWAASRGDAAAHARRVEVYRSVVDNVLDYPDAVDGLRNPRRLRLDKLRRALPGGDALLAPLRAVGFHERVGGAPPAAFYVLDDAPRFFDAPGTLALLALARNLVAEERANLQE